MTPHILLVGTDPSYQTLLHYRLQTQARSMDVQHVRTSDVALRELRDETLLVVMGLHLDRESGLDALDRFHGQRPDLPIVMLSTASDRSLASEALRLGATDVVTRGEHDLDRIESYVEERLSDSDLPFDGTADDADEKFLTGESAATQRVERLAERALRGDLTVALLGESGTGKERVARFIHEESNRSDGPFVVVNCAAIPADLAESAFFGHEKGAFTGAHEPRTGHFEAADGGTLFLDEVAELSPGLQAKLLRALQNREIQRVGSSTTISFDARVVCATNRDIRSMLSQGTFREDLYYRLFQFPIRLPPLRDRGQDVLLLAQHFLRKALERSPDASARSFSVDARRQMLTYHWPGNVRELRTSVERAVLLADDATITPEDLFPEWVEAELSSESSRSTTPDGPIITDSTESSPPDDGSSFPPSRSPAFEVSTGPVSPPQHAASASSADDILPLDDLKVLAARHAFHVCDGNVKKTAEALGVARSTVYRLLDAADE